MRMEILTLPATVSWDHSHTASHCKLHGSPACCTQHAGTKRRKAGNGVAGRYKVARHPRHGGTTRAAKQDADVVPVSNRARRRRHADSRAVGPRSEVQLASHGAGEARTALRGLRTAARMGRRRADSAGCRLGVQIGTGTRLTSGDSLKLSRCKADRDRGRTRPASTRDHSCHAVYALPQDGVRGSPRSTASAQRPVRNVGGRRTDAGMRDLQSRRDRGLGLGARTRPRPSRRAHALFLFSTATEVGARRS